LLPVVLGFHERFQAVEICCPKDAVLLDPGVDGAERLRVEFVDPIAAFAVFADKMGAAEKAQVLGDGGTGYGKGFRNLPGGLAAAAKEIQDRAAGGIR
jgi:hypothetical protein